MPATQRDRLQARLRERLCSICVYTLPDGSCGLHRDCPVYRHLEDLLALVAEIHGPSIEPYVPRLRELICSRCSAEHGGSCPHRSKLDCALDRYFHLVVEVIRDELNSPVADGPPATATS